ncbi:MAG: C45 family autoproteolytic acyltransferase/hydrolase [Candidatus Heimdallarchaeaceae archaeon]
MMEVNLKGSYFEMGVQVGEQLKKVGFNPENVIPKNYDGYDFLAKCEEIIQEHIPEIIENFKGMAKGGNFDYDRLKILPMTLFFDTPKETPPSCTVVVISGEYTETKKPIFFRNYDWNIDFEKFLTVTRAEPENGIQNIGVGDTYGGRYGGTNKAGLTIAMTGGRTYRGAAKPGIIMSIAVRWILDQFSTTEEAVTFLQKIPHVHGFNFVVCDQKGLIARVAATPEKVDVEYPKSGFLIQTNHYITKEMKMIENPELIFASSITRYQHAKNWFENRKGLITMDYIKKLTQKGLDEGGVCDHGVHEGVKYASIWSWIKDYSTSGLYLTPGIPCENEYRELDFCKS